ncbi:MULTISPECIES: metallophosphoesterase family protein [unclassified Prochlorococcus]|uniref:metallophosphoesterase family protein n=1 Tax=unclassified Prochlorococcus TaxID=2627481 RepID=UPI000533AC04|nr:MULTISPECIES: DNA repair exonuclease [unclassified Prochlorococcus]KGG16166.1 DNA double-strand break repair protein Mre11 [Prochlorococcus sp. MIT 0602]KGG17286.1 DNA double-strand break repair protein Mre11 [Prochlorococcus sp. MIT 0603]
MANFIHTADWQIGKPYLKVTDEQKRFKLRQERLNVIARIKDKAKELDSDFVLIAGDLFDSPTPSVSTVAEVLESIREINIPVIVIPGNHDHGALGTVWHSENFKKYQPQIAPNLILLLEPKPVELADAVILPCPLVRNRDSRDPTIWIRKLDWKTLSSTKPRIILAHGGVHDFKGQDYSLENKTMPISNGIINLQDLPDTEIDYIALGDWHNLKQVSKKAWYSGTPEPDRFNQGKDNQRGQVLQVEVSRGETPQVTPLPTGFIQWHNMSFEFSSDKDLDRFERQVDKLTSSRISRDLLSIAISGRLSLSGYKRYELLKKDLQNKLIRLKIKDNCQEIPKDEEIEQLTNSFEDPLIAQVANQLQERLKAEGGKSGSHDSITHIALCELHRMAMKN